MKATTLKKIFAEFPVKYVDPEFKPQFTSEQINDMGLDPEEPTMIDGSIFININDIESFNESGDELTTIRMGSGDSWSLSVSLPQFINMVQEVSK